MKKCFALFSLILLCFFAKAQSNEPASNPPKPVIVAALYPGGMDEFLRFVARNIVYPQDARLNKLHGKVILHMVIDNDGSVTDVKVLTGVSAAIDSEAVRVVRSSPRWSPATFNGRVVRAPYTLPINFDLSK